MRVPKIFFLSILFDYYFLLYFRFPMILCFSVFVLPQRHGFHRVSLIFLLNLYFCFLSNLCFTVFILPQRHGFHRISLIFFLLNLYFRFPPILCFCVFVFYFDSYQTKQNQSLGNLANSGVTIETNCSIIFSELKLINNPLGLFANLRYESN